MKKTILFLAAVTAFHFCMAQPPKVPAEKGDGFGQKITEENALTVEQLVTMMKGKENEEKVDVKVTGEVTDVCEAMGCWLKIKSADGNYMVRMKDHSFFVPLALEGKRVVLEGTASVKTTSVKMLKHYAEDAGKTKEEIDAIKEPKTDIVLEAKGILVL